MSATDFIVAAKGADGVALYHVPANAAGLSIKDALRADGTFSGTLTFKDVKVGAANLVAKGDEGGRGTAPGDGCGDDHDLRRTFRLHAADAGDHARLHAHPRAVRQSRSAAIRRCSTARSISGSRKSCRWWRSRMRCARSTIRRRPPDQISMAASRAKSRLGDAAHTIGRESHQAAWRDRLHRRIRRRSLSAPRDGAERLARQSGRASPPLRQAAAGDRRATREARERAVLGRVPAGRQGRRGLEFVQRRGIPRRRVRLVRQELSARHAPHGPPRQRHGDERRG